MTFHICSIDVVTQAFRLAAQMVATPLYAMTTPPPPPPVPRGATGKLVPPPPPVPRDASGKLVPTPPKPVASKSDMTSRIVPVPPPPKSDGSENKEQDYAIRLSVTPVEFDGLSRAVSKEWIQMKQEEGQQRSSSQRAKQQALL